MTNNRGQAEKSLFITDFDGTLLRSDGSFSQRDLDALKTLSLNGVSTAIATGRSLHSFVNSPGAELAVDYVIFTTGAGVVRKLDDELIYQLNLSAEMVSQTLGIMHENSLDFMLHHPVPDNHKYLFRRANNDNTDFESRIGRQDGFGQALNGTHVNGFGEAAQFLAIVPPDATRGELEKARNEFPGLSIVLATSPIDHQSGWIEFLHPDVSKGRTANWLANELGIDRGNTIAVGNDYNDLDLLEWAAHSFVVANAPDDLKSQFNTVSSNNNEGVAEAVDRWFSSQNQMVK